MNAKTIAGALQVLAAAGAAAISTGIIHLDTSWLAAIVAFSTALSGGTKVMNSNSGL